jgi:exodeoxyribonuclease VII small subunit
MSEPERSAVDGLAFDAALAELERTVAELETGGLALERTLALYERAVSLQQRCERLLGDAELRVRRLVEGARGAVAEADLRDEEAG